MTNTGTAASGNERSGSATSAGAGALDALMTLTPTLEGRLELVRAHLPGRIAFSTSLGLEDQAVLHALASTGIEADIFTLDTGRHFPETLATIAASEERYGLRIRLVAPDAAEVEELTTRDGIFGFRRSVSARKACCEVRKVRPLVRTLKGASGWITGLRREQSASRLGVAFAEWAENERLVKLNPIADWTLDRLEAYIAGNDIPVNPLHTEGYPSIGCQPCTRAIEAGEDIRAGRWWWEHEAGEADHKECGLHNRPRPGVPKTTTLISMDGRP